MSPPAPPDLPTLGRIVRFRSQRGVLAAIVVRVHETPMMISLTVFEEDGSTSRAVEVPHGDHTSIGKWHWPPRVREPGARDPGDWPVGGQVSSVDRDRLIQRG